MTDRTVLPATPSDTSESEEAYPRPSAATAAFALLFGFGLLMLGNGLQATLIGVRTQSEGFSATSTTLIMSGYFAGYLAGTKLVSRFLGRVGHIRVYAALASLASVASLIHAVRVDPVTWMGMRFLTGACLAGLYIVVESWLNDITTNATRGRLLGLYLIVTMGGFAGGNILFERGDPRETTLFVVASVLCSLSLVPIALSTTSAPPIVPPEPMPVMELARTVPTGVIGGGLIFPLYSLTVAYINDWMPRSKVVGSASTFALLIGIGAVLGPIVTGTLMSQLGNSYFFWSLAAANLALSAYLVWRLAFGDVLPENRKGRWVPLASRGASVLAAVSSRNRRRPRQ